MDAQLKIYNRDGNVTGELKTPDFLLSPWNPELVHQVYKSMASNKRVSLAHTKDRSEVSGGGKKPWKQKGTGRARQGSIRSPLWRHGGVSFGPRNTKSYSKKINKEMARKALVSALAYSFQIGRLKILDHSIEFSNTKELSRMIRNLSETKSTLLVLPENNTVQRFAQNIQNVEVVTDKNLNIHQVLNYYFVVLDQNVLELLNKKFGYGK